MNRFLVRYGLLGTLSAIALSSLPARADFYRLDGRFQCLDGADSSCGGPGRAELHPPLPPKPKSDDVPPGLDLDADLAGQPQSARNDVGPQHESGPSDPVLAIAAKIKTDRVSAADVQLLRSLSRNGNARATELLAWCDYKGVGAPRDSVAAYVLYGIAALAGMPHARANQAVIYEYALSSDQRQRVLDIENEVRPNR
jgi:hypothetical protein